MSKSIYHEDTEYPVCPWCGYEYDEQDPDDIVLNEKTKCSECGHHFKTHIEPETYHTSKVTSRGKYLPRDTKVNGNKNKKKPKKKNRKKK